MMTMETMYTGSCPQPAVMLAPFKRMARGMAVANSRTPSAATRVKTKVRLAVRRARPPNRSPRYWYAVERSPRK
jgi:hypothetical protein